MGGDPPRLMVAHHSQGRMVSPLCGGLAASCPTLIREVAAREELRARVQHRNSPCLSAQKGRIDPKEVP